MACRFGVVNTALIENVNKMDAQGIWRTTSTGSRVFIAAKNGKVRIGGPSGKILEDKDTARSFGPDVVAKVKTKATELGLTLKTERQLDKPYSTLSLVDKAGKEVFSDWAFTNRDSFKAHGSANDFLNLEKHFRDNPPAFKTSKGQPAKGVNNLLLHSIESADKDTIPAMFKMVHHSQRNLLADRLNHYRPKFRKLINSLTEPKKPTTNAGPNCGIAKGGFAKGNKCAAGGGGQTDGKGAPNSPKVKEGTKAKAKAAGVTRDKVEPLKEGTEYKPNVNEVDSESGVTKASRVGVPSMELPPPPKVGRLPNLTKHERQVESDFAKAYEDDPDGVAGQFLDIVRKGTTPGTAPTFGTDDAKVLSESWSHPELTLGQRSENRATLNLALHQTANAITKRAFVQHLDSLSKGDEIMVTVGGCGAGKGYALGNVPEAGEVKSRSKAIWDSAGDQNATENPWIQEEAEKRGLKVNYVFVHADPYTQWAHPERGVVKRAQNPEDGRMVDAHVFADSYAIGAKNFQAFHDKHKNNINAQFTFLENGNPPKKLSAIPKAAFVDAKNLREYSLNVIDDKPDLPPHIKRGATIGRRVWGDN